MVISSVSNVSTASFDYLAANKPPTDNRVAETEDLPPSEDVVEFKEAGAMGDIVVVTRTQLNESRRLIDIIA